MIELREDMGQAWIKSQYDGEWTQFEAEDGYNNPSGFRFAVTVINALGLDWTEVEEEDSDE